MSDKDFVQGIIFKLPSEKAPEYVKINGSMKRVQLMEWLAGRSEEYINFDVKLSSKGNIYCEVSQWKPKAKEKAKKGSGLGIDSDIPF